MNIGRHWKVSCYPVVRSKVVNTEKVKINLKEINLRDEDMSFVSRQCLGLKLLRKLTQPGLSRSIGDVNKSEEVNIFDVFHTKKLQKERSAMRYVFSI